MKSTNHHSLWTKGVPFLETCTLAADDWKTINPRRKSLCTSTQYDSTTEIPSVRRTCSKLLRNDAQNIQVWFVSFHNSRGSVTVRVGGSKLQKPKWFRPRFLCQIHSSSLQATDFWRKGKNLPGLFSLLIHARFLWSTGRGGGWVTNGLVISSAKFNSISESLQTIDHKNSDARSTSNRICRLSWKRFLFLACYPCITNPV